MTWRGEHGPHEQVLTLLAATPRHIGELTAGLAPARLRTRPGEDEWSANEVLAHLRACADARGGAILTIRPRTRRRSGPSILAGG